MNMIEVTGVITRVFDVDKNGFCRFYLDTPNSNIPRTKTGKAMCEFFAIHCFPYLPVKLLGYEKEGYFFVTSLTPIYMNDDLCINYISKNCASIGRKTAQKIVLFFKDNLFSMSSSDLKLALEDNFPTLKEKQVSSLLQALCLINPTLSELEQFLISYDVPYDIIFSIYSKYQEKAIEVIKEHPYYIGSEFLLPFYIMDRIAFSLNKPNLSEERIVGLIMNTLYSFANDGHTYVDINVLYKRVDYRSTRTIYQNSIPPLLFSNALLNKHLFTVIDNRVALKKYYDIEKEIVNQLRIFCRSTKQWKFDDSDIKQIEDDLNIQYGKDQRNSFSLMKDNTICILTGGPGTGKTSFLKGLINLYKKLEPTGTFALCAPTGRAAKRMTESTGYEALTIHKLIDCRPFGQGEVSVKDKSNPIQADCIIVDELSMVDVELFLMLLKAIKPGTKIVLVGDENQIMSVGAGNVLHDLLLSGKVPVYRLKENFRQGNIGNIYSNSELILDGKLPIEAYDFSLIQTRDANDSYKTLSKIMKESYDFDNIFKTQLIEPSYKGVAGVYKMNNFMHNELLKNDNVNLDNGIITPIVGDKVMFTTTDYEEGYVNGDIGEITHMSKEEITIKNDVEIFTVSISALRFLTLAYSYPIHKSQGSENDEVVIYLPENMPKSLLNRNLLYTAVTRAKLKVTIVYENNSLKTAIDTYEEIKRNTNLKFLLLEL